MNDNKNEKKATTENSMLEPEVGMKELNDAMKKLIALQAQQAMVKAQKRIKIIKEQRSKAEKWLDDTAARYKVEKSSEYKKIRESYSEILEQIEDIHNKSIHVSTAIVDGLQTVEQEAIINISNCQNKIKENKPKMETIKKEIKKIENSEEYKYFQQEIAKTKKEMEDAINGKNGKSIAEVSDRLQQIMNNREKLFDGKKIELSSLEKETQELSKNAKLLKQDIRATRKGIKEEKSSMQKSSETAKNAMEIANKNKNAQLVATKKKNAISKLFNTFAIIVGGKKRFNRDVIEPLKEELAEIKQEKIPELKASVQAKIKEGTKKIEELETRIKESAVKAKEKGKDVVKTIGDKGTKVAKTVGDKGVKVAKAVGHTSVKVAKTVGIVATLPVVAIYGIGETVEKSIVGIVETGKDLKNKALIGLTGKIEKKAEEIQKKLEIDKSL